MTFEICCQCNEHTGRGGRADDSLYTDNDWGPYCPDCWQDADYWRCIADEKITEIEKLRAALKDAERLFNEALPKFNWGASALDGNAIQLLNEVPLKVRAALSAAEPAGVVG